MKRYAYFVVTPEAPSLDPLPGASRDGDAWMRFLTSPEGGAWKHSEVVVHTNPSKLKVEVQLAAIRAMNYDYVLLAFSGHGDATKDQYGAIETWLHLSNKENISERTFTAKCARELVVIDACRQIRVQKSAEKLESFSATNEAVSAVLSRRLAEARRLFDDAIIAQPSGRSLVYSCDSDQTASDSPSYSQILIKTTEGLARPRQKAATISIKDAFDGAKSIAATQLPQQTPVFNGGRRLSHFPFGVATTSSIITL